MPSLAWLPWKKGKGEREGAGRYGHTGAQLRDWSRSVF